jgi:dihydroxyacetone kinase
VTEPSTQLAGVLLAVADALIAQKDRLNQLDGVAGDGDLGITTAAGATALRDASAEIGALELPAAIQRIGMELAKKAPSTSGTLIAFGFLAAGRAAEAGDGEPTVADLLDAGAAAIAQRGGVAAGDRTMLDALLPAAAAARAAAERGATIREVVSEAAAAADEGAQATATMAATVGRAGWLADRAAGHEDAGARLVAIVFAAAAAAAGEAQTSSS